MSTYSNYRPPPVGARHDPPPPRQGRIGGAHGHEPSAASFNPYNDPSFSNTEYQIPYEAQNPSYDLPTHDSRVRTPSPTPSENASLQQKYPFAIIDKVKMVRANPRILREPKTIKWIIITIVLIVLGALFYFYHTQIVHAIQPYADKLKNLPGGWAIIIAIFFVISFPPLFGHEILAIVCGLVYGVWIGFAIVSAGTFIGELGNFYAFKYFLHKRGQKWERENIFYGCIAKLVREGGFKIALIARYSAVPGHFTTAVFSTVGMPVWIFLIAAFLSLPKQFITVYIGTLMEASNPSTGDRVASDIVGVITVLVTVAAMWYLNREVNRVKPEVILERRRRRKPKHEGSGFSQSTVGSLYQSGGLQSVSDFNGFNSGPGPAEQTVPLTSSYDAPNGFQQWDAQGRAVGYTGDPRFNAAPAMPAPQPQRPGVSLLPPSSTASPSAYGRGGLGRQESADTVRWENQANPENQGHYRLNTMSPVSGMHNPFDDEPSALPYAAPQGPPLSGPTAQPAEAPTYSSSPTTYAPPQRFASPPPSSPRGSAPKTFVGGAASPKAKGGAAYGFAAPQNSFGGGPSGASSPKPQKQAFSPPPGPPPGYPGGDGKH